MRSPARRQIASVSSLVNPGNQLRGIRRLSFSPSVRCGPSTSSSYSRARSIAVRLTNRPLDEELGHLIRDINRDLHLRFVSRGAKMSVRSHCRTLNSGWSAGRRLGFRRTRQARRQPTLPDLQRASGERGYRHQTIHRRCAQLMMRAASPLLHLSRNSPRLPIRPRVSLVSGGAER